MVNNLDREYLENYEQTERDEFERFRKRIQEGKFDFEKDKFPTDERFWKLQKPVAVTTVRGAESDNFWAQVPFCGSLVLLLPPYPKTVFEKVFFKTSEIPSIISFIKETGRLQFALNMNPCTYEGLDYLDPVFVELNPPVYTAAPLSPTFGDKKEIQKAEETFYTLGNVGFFRSLLEFRAGAHEYDSTGFNSLVHQFLSTYVVLKLTHPAIAKDVENLMVDAPIEACAVLNVSAYFIVDPLVDTRVDMRNYTTSDIKISQKHSTVCQPKEMRFPCEIGKFLLRKLTYAPEGLDACKELMYHYDANDLRKVQESLNEAIVANHPDIVNKTARELSEILDNVWSNKTITRKVEGLRIGIPLSMAAIGTVAAGPIGAAGGFLAGLGYNVVDKSIDLGTQGLSERLAKLKTKSYQANIYSFKKKYRAQIVRH